MEAGQHREFTRGSGCQLLAAESSDLLLPPEGLGGSVRPGISEERQFNEASGMTGIKLPWKVDSNEANRRDWDSEGLREAS